ncbi:MAG: GNAT family N-acetyltransferase [Desulfobacterales bacterium]
MIAHHFIRIRKANSADIALLSSIIRKSFRDVAVKFGLTPENCPKHPSNCTDDELNGLPVGCVAIEKATNDLCYLERLAVLPEKRCKGFGNQLAHQVLDTARAWGTKSISIGIIAEQTDLKMWYQKIGFKEGETKEFSHLPFCVCFMTYEIGRNLT